MSDSGVIYRRLRCLTTAGDAVTVATATDPDGDGTFTYSISDTTNYAIDATGNVTLTQAGADLVNTNSGADLPAFTVTADFCGGADAGSALPRLRQLIQV